MTSRLYLFTLANLGIVAGYMFLAFGVVPKAAARLRRTKIGGILFFMTCGLTHFELALHSLARGEITLEDFTSYHMLVIHGVQVVAVWMFVTGLYVEFVKWGPWRAAHEYDGESVHAGRLVGVDKPEDLPGIEETE